MSESLDLDAFEATVRRDLTMGPMRTATISNLDALDLIERLRRAEGLLRGLEAHPSTTREQHQFIRGYFSEART